jgi:pimeloyl-ACP methyl ester carboxylesterase
MYRRHVYADPGRISPEFLDQKVAVARRKGGRFGSAAFVTGALDPVRDRNAFLTLASPPPAPTLVVYGADAPPRSRTEMEALAELPGIQSCLLSGGALGIHEEEPDAVAGAVEHFLRVTGGC